MEAPVVASVIASTTSLVVAVVGLLANGRSQRNASQQAHGNALALFERQAGEQAKARADEADERRRLLHMDERRRLYARLPTLIIELDLSRLHRKSEPSSVGGVAEIGQRDFRDVMADLLMVCEEIRLVGSSNLSAAAVTWANAAFDNESEAARKPLRMAFVCEARADLGTADFHR